MFKLPSITLPFAFPNPFAKSVSSVMSSFQKTINDLGKVAKARRNTADKHDQSIVKLLDKVDVLTTKANEAEAEADAADRLAEKLKDSFGL